MGDRLSCNPKPAPSTGDWLGTVGVVEGLLVSEVGDVEGDWLGVLEGLVVGTVG